MCFVDIQYIPNRKYTAFWKECLGNFSEEKVNPAYFTKNIDKEIYKLFFQFTKSKKVSLIYWTIYSNSRVRLK